MELNGAYTITREECEKLEEEYLINDCIYYLMKSSGEMPSRFRVLNEDGTVKKGTDTELAEWAHSQPDWYNGKHYIFDGPYMEPFNSNVRSMRVLVINDSQAVLEPLLEAAALIMRYKEDSKNK